MTDENLLQGTVILFLFASTISLIEISCNKINGQARPQSPKATRTILFAKEAIYSISGIDTIYAGGNLFLCDIDGNNIRQIPIPLPANQIYIPSSGFTACLTPNADSVIFNANIIGNGRAINLYICAVDGSGLRQVVSAASNHDIPFLCDVK